MSKKSTSRAGNDGDADCGSENAPSSSSEGSKCISPPHLSRKKEGATGPSGDYSSTHKIPTTNSDGSCRNHAVGASESTHKSDPASLSSLDEDLYGTSDAFKENLEFLKKKLSMLNLKPAENLEITSCTSSSKNSCKSCQNCQNDMLGYLSTRETYLNLSSPFENCSQNFKACSNSVIRTIYETEIYETDRTASSDSYRTPTKKICQRERTPRCLPSSNPSKIAISASPGTLNLSLCLDQHQDNSSPNTMTLSTPKSSTFPSPRSAVSSSLENLQLLELIDLSNSSSASAKKTTEGSSTGSSINYVVPNKRRCIRNKTPTFVNNVSTAKGIPPTFGRSVDIQCNGTEKLQTEVNKSKMSSEGENYLLHIKPPSEGEDHSSRVVNQWSSPEEIENRSLPSSGILELGLNLPSSIGEECTSSNKTTPLEPNIIIIDTSNRKKEKFRKRNKVAPVSGSSPSKPSSAMAVCSSGDHSECSFGEIQQNYLYQRYYQDTPEISSNPTSTPPCAVSTCAARTSTVRSVTTEVSRNSGKESGRVCISLRPEPTTQTRFTSFKYEEVVPKVFEPLFSSCLDVPKISRFRCIFPAFTKITSFPGTLLHEPCAGDCGDDLEEEFHKSQTEESYKHKAEVLFNSPTQSTTAKRKTGECGDSASFAIETPNIVEDKNGSPILRIFKKKIPKRKVQSTDLSFYSVPSYITLDAEFSHRNSRKSSDSFYTTIDTEEKCANCFCFNILFPRLKMRFFT